MLELIEEQGVSFSVSILGSVVLVAVAGASEDFLLVFRVSGNFLREGLSSSVVAVDLSEL